MLLKIDNSTLQIRAISPVKPSLSKDCTIIENPDITTMNPDYIVVWRDNDMVIHAREMTDEEKAIKDAELHAIKKRKALLDLIETTKKYIEYFYPEVKQRSDVNDKEYWGSWLLYHFPSDYTLDNLYQDFYESAAAIISKKSDIKSEIANLATVTTFTDDNEKATYQYAIEQLLKVAVRQGWVQSCKAEHHRVKS
jgi:hypothetical protein